MSYLIDTNVISELVRVKPEPRVVQWFDTLPDSALYLSVLTLGELRKGVEKLTEMARRENCDCGWRTTCPTGSAIIYCL